ncbi:GNAT family N-acetyltransferase [Jannaschia sp. LMIT008]|uniref:GNAT family N-acetyltransferase n=1 Tax=Jannaschia maritima TaxID=3032585 RepID=UPI002811CA3F|nr:GNAT family N-acetyltransferase [Jannaschia sp. LMIT008]
MLIVGPADPGAPGPRALLERSHALMRALFEPDQNHVLDVAALRGDDIRFLAARKGDTVLGVGALASRDGYAEVKSMFTDPAARGRGVADAILRALIDLGVADGHPVIRLETGHGLDAAHRLYERHGFVRCGPFGAYPDDPASLFYERAADP